jgi:hypothetical protein
MTDQELLVLCAAAFAVIPIAAKSRKLLISIQDEDSAPYAGNRSHILARVMKEKIEDHLAKTNAKRGDYHDGERK